MSNFIFLENGDCVEKEKISFVGKIQNITDGRYPFFNIVVDGSGVQLMYTEEDTAKRDREMLVS